MTDSPESDEGAPLAPARSTRARARLTGLGADDAFVRSFKERVYATFTGLAIVLVVAANDAEPDHAFFALVLGVLAITAAGFASEIVTHLAVSRDFPGGAELAILGRIAGGALGTLVVPGILVFLAWLGVLSLESALRAAAIVYIVTLAVIGWLAVRRSRMPWWKQVIALAILVSLGLVVLALQTLAHAV